MANTTLRAYLNDLKALLEREALEEVIGHCRHIIQHFPKNIEAYRTLGSALLERGRRAEAADVFQRVLAAIPDDFTAHVGLGSAYEESNVNAAIWHLERALEQEPNHQALQEELSRMLTVRDGSAPGGFNLTRGALARVYLKSQLYSQAIVELQGALQQNKERIDLDALLARTLWMSSHPVEASEVALQILRTYPDNVEANRIMAALWLAMGRPSDAEPFIARLEQLDPFLAWDTLHPEGTPVPRDAFQLPRLQWDARTAAAMDSSLPDWVSTIGDVFEAQEQAAGALGVGPIVTPWDEDAPAPLAEEFTPVESVDAIPDWLSDVVEPAPEPPLSETSATVAAAFADYAPEWLADEETSNAPDAFGPTSSAESLEDALGWLQAGPTPETPSDFGQQYDPGAAGTLPLTEDFGAFQMPAGEAEPDELPPDFAQDAFSWLSTAPLPAEDAGAPAAPRGRMPGETGPLTMLEPPAGTVDVTPPIPAEPAEFDADALSWLQTGNLPAPDSESAPALDFSAFEADLESESGAPDWLQAGDLTLTEPSESLETSAEFLGDIEDTAGLWPAGTDTAEGAALEHSEPAADVSFDSPWLADLAVTGQTTAADSSAPADASEPEIALDFGALAADAAGMAGEEGGDWLSGLGAAVGEGPSDQAPDLDLDAWAAGAEDLQLDLAPAGEIPDWLTELRQTELSGGPDTGSIEAEAPLGGELTSSAEASFETYPELGEEISLESLDLTWLRSKTPRPAEAPDAGYGPLGDLFLEDEPELAESGAKADVAQDEPGSPEEAALASEQADTLSWMRQVGILEEPPPALPIDEDLLASVAPEEQPEAGAPSAEAPAEGGVTEAEVLAFLRNSAADASGDLFAQMNQHEKAEAEGQTPGAQTTSSVPAFSAPLPAGDETVLEDDFLAALEVGVSSAPRGDIADSGDWLSTLGGAPGEVLGEDWLADMSNRAPVTPMEEPAPVEPMAEEAPEAPEPVEDVPLWQRPAVTASLAQAAAAMDMFNAEEPLVSEDDIPAWMREAADELLVAPTDTTPIASEDEPGPRGLLSFMPQTDTPSRTRVDTGVLEPDGAPEWLEALSTDQDAAPEAETALADVQPDWLATPAEATPEATIDTTLDVTETEALLRTEMPESDVMFEAEAEADASELGMDWLDNVVAAEAKGPRAAPTYDEDSEEPAEAAETFGAEIDLEPGFEPPMAGDIPDWMRDMGLMPPAEAQAAASSPPPQAGATPLEELDFSSLEGGASGAEPETSSAPEPFDFLSGLDAPESDRVAKATDLADTTVDAGLTAPAPEPEPPAPPTSPAAPSAETGTRFSFKKEPAWKRKRPGTDGAP